MIKRKDIEMELKYYERYLGITTRELEKLKDKVPSNVRLRAVRHNNGYQYFLRTDRTDKNGIYIKKENIRQAQLLSQVEYYDNLRIVLEDRIKRMKRLEKVWVDDPFTYIEEKMSLGKRKFIKSPVVSDQTYIDNWLTQEYKSLGFKEDYPEFYARNNLRVRSKSEVIIADMLDEVGIPFLYEKPVKLGSGVVHPDFTLLDIGNRKEIYWEHFGMMDDIEYRNNAFFKIRNYESNGLFQHDSFIYTFETNVFPLNIKEIRKMIKMLKVKLGYCNI